MVDDPFKNLNESFEMPSDGFKTIPPPDHTNYATEAIKLVIGQRNEDYGLPTQDFNRLAKIWSGLLADKLKVDLTAKEVTLLMAALKINREMHKHKPDNLIDLHGYGLLAEWLETGKKPSLE